jgi:prepilin-type N-terminal cleavage/methylation domain-containing protein
MLKNRNARRGFTLAELLVVVFVVCLVALGLIAALVAIGFYVKNHYFPDVAAVSVDLLQTGQVIAQSFIC